MRGGPANQPGNAGGKEGRILFASHRFKDDQNELRMDEIRESEELVAHESRAAFLEYREKLRASVDGEGVIRGNTFCGLRLASP